MENFESLEEEFSYEILNREVPNIKEPQIIRKSGFGKKLAYDIKYFIEKMGYMQGTGAKSLISERDVKAI